MTVRIITAKIRCRGYRDEDIIVVTSLLDPVKFPKETILEWYGISGDGKSKCRFWT